MKKTLYTGLGMVVWRVGKRYVRRRARGARNALADLIRRPGGGRAL